ncbi:MAG: hypothetical protein AB1773_01360 [Pseudomonadota bacterium]
MNIGDVDFGELDAESEKNLSGYFVDTGVLGKLASGQKQFVIGRKGSGKTALFRLATPATLKTVQVVEVEFDQYPWEFHRQLKQAGMMAESAYEASWRFLLLLMMVREWAESGDASVKSKAADLLKKILPDPNRGFWSSLLSRLRNPTKIGLPGGGVAGYANVSLGAIDLGKEDASYAVSVMSMHLGALAAIASATYASHPVVIKVDRLDDGWDATPDSQSLIIGELKAARAIGQQLHSPGKPAPVITFLRSDIYDTVRFNDKNKMATAIERLEWPNSRLMDVLNRRIATSLKISPDEAWAAVFSVEEMRQRAKPQSYFLRRTMGRPRDVIAFAIHCRDVAVERNHPRVETTDIYDAEDRFSQHLLAELSDELHKQRPDLEHILDTLRELGRMTFTLGEWTEVARRRSPTLSESIAKEQLGFLYDASVIGVARIGGSKGGSQQVFNYSSANVKPDFSGRMHVHPGLKKGLQLKEGAAGEAEDEEPGTDSAS